MKKKLDLKEIGLITTFENMTGATVKEHLVDPSTNTLIFVVKQGDVRKAIGKNGVMIRRVCEKLKRKVKVVELSDDAVKFFKVLIMPLEASDVKADEGVLRVSAGTSEAKAHLIGRNKQKVLFLNEVMKKFFGVEVVIV